MSLSGTDLELPNVNQDHAASPIPEEFVKLFTQHQRRIYLFILAQVGKPDVAEDILQESNVVILNKHHQFELGTNFFAWACRISTFEILKHRDRSRRDRHLFSDDFIKQVAEETIEQAEEMEQRRQALSECLAKLRPQDQELIRQRYAPGESGKSLAEDLGRPPNSVYQSLGRIRKTLLECIQRRMSVEPGT